MLKISTAFILALNLSVAAFAAKPLEEVQVAPVAPYAAGSESAEMAVNKDCNWNAQVITSLVKETKGSAKVATQDLSSFQGRKLVMSATNSTASGPASEKAPQWLAVTGKLLDKNAVIGDFEFRREITKGSLQDCKYVKNLSDKLGDDLASWLEKPAFFTKIASRLRPLDKDSVAEDDRKNCPWDTFIPKTMAESNDGLVGITEQDINKLKSRRLLLTLNNSRFAGGGVYSGAKWMEIDGKLMDEDKLIGSFTVRRWTIKGWTSCGVVERLGEELSDDILNWLKAPGMNTLIGDAK